MSVDYKALLYDMQNGITETLSKRPDDYCFLDFETCNTATSCGTPQGDLTEVGADVYTAPGNSFANILTWQIGKAGVDRASVQDWHGGERLEFDSLCPAFTDFYDRAVHGEAWFVAWNMNFDRAVWNAEATFPFLRIDMTLDAMVQALVSNLPGKLHDAARVLGLGGKHEAGKLMDMFCNWDAFSPAERPDLWDAYNKYGERDTELLAKVFWATRKLSKRDWNDYWVNERINERGMPVDVGFAKRADAVAKANIARINRALAGLTEGVVDKVSQIQRIAAWVYDRLDSAEARELMTKTWKTPEEDEDGEPEPDKISLAKDKLEALIAWFEGKDRLSNSETITLEVLKHRFYGGSSTKKFEKILLTQREGTLRNQYVFNGAAQTGRYSSRGVQIHNLPRASLGPYDEGAFIETINQVEL